MVAASGWGCFAEFPMSGFIFAREYWGATDDRLSFVRLNLSPDAKTISGSFRFDLNSDSLMLEINGFRKVRDLQTTKTKAKEKLKENTFVDLTTYRPLAFLNALKEKRHGAVTVMPAQSKGWITKEDVLELTKHLGDMTPAAPVVSVVSSSIPDDNSTVDNEVRFMIRGFHQDLYPPALHSLFNIEKSSHSLGPIRSP